MELAVAVLYVAFIGFAYYSIRILEDLRNHKEVQHYFQRDIEDSINHVHSRVDKIADNVVKKPATKKATPTAGSVRGTAKKAAKKSSPRK
ncbi:hypothetical protein UFOVP621_74 [uncultured Caudovirales phage]|uniref:Uncharacterized protein n=1 Tax=uncultured Caudovirales phage TaxID=2100421 RepID=A0A6J5N3K4_9CAUD|nr:hypothetical protein UFOVP621_74 [uncultured Caudovirales phage]